MCLQDVRLGRKSQARVTVVAAAGGRGTTAFPPNPNRMSVVAAAYLGDGIVAGDQVAIGTVQEGGFYPLIVLNSTIPFGTATLQEHGQAVTGELVVQTNDGITPDVRVGESFLVLTPEEAVQ